MRIIIYTLFFLSCIANIHAQVNIGSEVQPEKGLLLQLKDQVADADNVTATTGGLILPRVNLKRTGTLEPFVSYPIAVGQEGLPMELMGLVVYNTNKCLNPRANALGLHVWDGEAWRKQLMSESDVAQIEYLTDEDKNIYKARRFGSAGVWMIQNLRVTKYTNGVNIPLHNGLSQTTPAYAYPSAEADKWNESHNSQGLLYNWAAATRLSSSTAQQAQNNSTDASGNEVEIVGPMGPGPNGLQYIQGICPLGWYLPTDRDWNKLEKELYDNGHIYSEYTQAEVLGFNPPGWNASWEYGDGTTNPSALGWRGSSTEGHGKVAMGICPPLDTFDATNGKSKLDKDGGFSVILYGSVEGASSSNYGKHAFYWTASSFDATSAWMRSISSDKASVNRDKADRGSLFTIRCKKVE